MKLPSAIVASSASHAGRSPDLGQGLGASGEKASQFDDILSDVRTNAVAKASPPPVDAGAGNPAGAATPGFAVVSGNGKPTTLDGPMIGTSPLAPHPATDPARSATEGDAKDGGPGADPSDGATPAPATDGPPPQSLFAAFLFASPLAGRQIHPRQSASIAAGTASSAPAASNNAADPASTTAKIAPRAGAPPLLFDVTVLSQPAPVTARSSGLALAGMAEVLSGAPARNMASRPTTTPSPENDGPATAAAADIGAIGPTAVPLVDTGRGDGGSSGSSSEPAKRAARDDGLDAASKDGAPSPVGGTSPALPETPPNALPTLSQPVRQVADTLARFAAEAGAPAAAPVPEVATAPPPALARTLVLQISPADHGTVAIRMHATGGSLDVRLTASDPRTAGLLSRERDALAATLQDGRTALHSLVIQDGSGAPQPGGHHATRSDPSSAGARDPRQGGDAGAGGSGNQRRQQPDGRPRREDAPVGGRGGVTVGGAQASGGGRTLLV